MRRRLTARVLLFDPQGRLLLMKGRLPSAPEAPGAWFTIGGGARPGESILAAAAREIGEETGFTQFELGPVVWRRTGSLPLAGGEPVWFDEHYVVARCAGGEVSRAGWDETEQMLIDDIRWWTLGELSATDEPVFPPGLAGRLGPIAAGRYPTRPKRIPWS